MTLLRYSVREKKVIPFPQFRVTNFNAAINQQFKSTYQLQGAPGSAYVWVEHSPHYSWCDVWDVSGTSSFKRSERSKKHQLLFIIAWGRGGGAKLILLLLLLLSELTVPASLTHTYTHKPISSILFLSFFPSLCPPFLALPHLFLLSFFLFHSLSCIHYLSFSRTHSIRRDPSTNIFLSY